MYGLSKKDLDTLFKYDDWSECESSYSFVWKNPILNRKEDIIDENNSAGRRSERITKPKIERDLA